VPWPGPALRPEALGYTGHEMLAVASPRIFRQLAVGGPGDLVFGRAPHPVRCGFGLEIGAGQVFPEVNFTLPALGITEATWDEVRGQYEEMAAGVIRRASALAVPGLVLEFELLPAMTERPEWGAEITRLLRSRLEQAYRSAGLRSALRVTPVDIRDQGKPPRLRAGRPAETLLESIRACVDAGADILSIESVGGKEVHDQGLLYGDVRGIALGLAVLAPRDMQWLWGRIAAECEAGQAIPGGDSACGFANTAMQLAHQRMLPEVLAAVVRAMGAARSLVAFENGAVGPSKDCAYEGPVLKAITGCPISMEGKSASCAHFSPLGNIAAAMCDLWSNESVQNVRLLSGSAPEAFTELLAYDCRLMNTATACGGAIQLRDWLTASDEWLSPQAAVLSPEAACKIAEAILTAPEDPYRRTIAAGRAAIEIIAGGWREGRLALTAKEQQWLARLAREFDGLPPTAEQLIAETEADYGPLYDRASYGL
jgi:methanol--5-hydroxybenzimidazolylcobamide Co-methyltransferase